MVGARTSRIAGKVRIAMPLMIGLEMFAPRLAELRRQFPEVQLDIDLFDRAIDPIAEGFDIAIMSNLYALPSSMVARPLADSPIVLCASPGYLAGAGMPLAPGDLASHFCVGRPPVVATLSDQWRLTHADGTAATVHVNVVLRSNDFIVMRTAVREGLGIGMLIKYSVDADLAAGRLVQVLPDWHLGVAHVDVVYPSRQYLPRRVRAIVDFLLAQGESLRTEGAYGSANSPRALGLGGGQRKSADRLPRLSPTVASR
jgi:DNA-binding transcriptional LysR family regulator